MESVKDEDWYQNTLFVIVADQVTTLPENGGLLKRTLYTNAMVW